MSDRWLELGRRAVATPGWRWLPGMRDLAAGRLVSTDGDRLEWAWPREIDKERYQRERERSAQGEGEHLPDLRDPATLGALLFGLLPTLGVHLVLDQENPARAEGYRFLGAGASGRYVRFPQARMVADGALVALAATRRR